ncbi:MAG TPA: cation diffusion facilitator family transporter [Gemmatimonadaceae bacterium]|nr:cation diffusion facilitator family transporter [Gemmatimonadaceae bacterium]
MTTHTGSHAHHAHDRAHGLADGHAHVHGAPSTPAARRALVRALVLTLVVAGAEVAGGLIANSLALIADAGHMVTDVAALSLALFAAWLGRRPPQPNQTFGARRWEILAAWINGAALFVISGAIMWEAIGRLSEPPEVQGGLMLGVAIVGLATNGVSAWWLHGQSHSNLNVRGAYLHVLGDLAGSGATIAAALVLLLAGWPLADPIASMVVAILVLLSSWRLMRDATDVLLEATPRHIDLAEVRTTLERIPAVESVHDLHVWTVGGGVVAMSAHAVLARDTQQHDVLGESRRAMERLGIAHVTIQVEAPALDGCGDCAPTNNNEGARSEQEERVAQ